MLQPNFLSDLVAKDAFLTREHRKRFTLNKTSCQTTNMTSGDQINPYAPALPTTEGELDRSDVISLESFATPSLAKLILRWTLVCSIAAGPSFVVGYDVSNQQIAAMSLGVILFIVIYVTVDMYTRRWPWRQSVIVRRILIFCYATRIAVSVFYPIGMAVDLFAGIVSVSIVGEPIMPIMNEPRSDDSMTFATTLALTIVQGFVLNLVLAVWGLLAFIVVITSRFVRDHWTSLPSFG